MDQLIFNPYDIEVQDNPLPTYAMMREADPVHLNLFGGWTLFNYADAQALLRDPRHSVEDANVAPSGPLSAIDQLRADRRGGSRAILNIDPPDHDRLRRLVSKAFTPRTVAALEPRIQEMVHHFLDAIDAAGGGDIISDIAFPLPFLVISEMLGMPKEDSEIVREWSHAIVKTLDPILSEEELLTAITSSDLMVEYVRERIVDKRSNPDDLLLSRLITAEDDGDMLDEQELLDQIILLYIAGHETTVNLIGNATLALLNHPDQMALLGANPELGANATEELLRWDSPVQYSRRIAITDFEIAGKSVKSGEFVLTCLGSANHDPKRWGPTAGVLDLAREGAGAHLSFGSGVHHCLGAALARLEGRVALTTIASRFPTLGLAAPVTRNGRVVLRGLDTLPVAIN